MHQWPADLVGEGEADGASTFVGEPVALGCESTAGDGVCEVFEAGRTGECLRWSSLSSLSVTNYEV